jgi:hypothetical protein
MNKNSQFNINPTDLLLTNSFFNNNGSHKTVNKYINNNNTTDSNINVQKHFKTPWPSKYNNIPKPLLSNSAQDISSEKYRKIKKTNILLNSIYRNSVINPIANNYNLNLGKEFNNVFKIEIVDFAINRKKIPINNDTDNFGWQYPTYDSLKTSNSEYTLYPSKYNTISAIPGVTSNLIDCKVISDQDSNQSVYTQKIKNEFGTISDLKYNFEQSMSLMRIDTKNKNDPDFIKLKWPNQTFGNPTSPSEEESKQLLYKYFYRESYPGINPSSSSLINKSLRTPNINFHLDINEKTQQCYIVNRRDLYRVVMLQSFKYNFTTKLEVPGDVVTNDFIISNTNLFQVYIPCLYPDTPTTPHNFKLITLEDYNAGLNPGTPNTPYYERFIESGENLIITMKLPFYNIERLLADETYLKNAFINSWISYPTVFTGLPSFGAINSDLLNNTPFFYNILYHLNIYDIHPNNFPKNDDGTYILDEFGNRLMPLSYFKNLFLPSFISTWYVYDIFQVKCSADSPLYMRMSCKLSTGNINDRPLDLNGTTILANINTTYIFNDQFRNIVQNQDLKKICCDISGSDVSGCDIGTDIGGHFNFGVVINNSDNNAIVGRAHPIRLLANTVEFQEKFNNYIGYKTSVLDILGYINTHGNSNIKVISMKQPYRWVNTNFQDVNIPQLYAYNENIRLNQLFNLNFPQNKLKIEFNNNEYYISSNPYLYLKLLINGTTDEITSDYLIANNIDSSSLNNIYYDIDFYKKNNINSDIFNKNNNLSNILTVVNLDKIPSSNQYIKLNKVIELYNKPINKLKTLRVQLILPNGELFMQNEEHYLNIIIYEKINVLKDTLLNTKDNTTTTTGIASVYDT